MDIRDPKRKRKVVSSKLTKLSLKKSAQESKTAEDSFDGFGSFALSLQSSKEIDGTSSSSGEEKSCFLNKNTYPVNIIDLLPSGNEVRDSSQSQTQPPHYKLLLDKSLPCKTSFELSDVKCLKGSTCESDESFAENFETPSKAKHCRDKSGACEEIRNQEVVVNDISLVCKVENDIISLHSSQTVSEESSDDNTPLTKCNNYCTETDRSLPVLPSLDKFAVSCVTTEYGRDHVYDTVNKIIPNSVLEEETTGYLLVNESKQEQELVHALKSEVTNSSLEGADACVLQDTTSRDARNIHDVDDEQLSPYFSASDLTCPLCWKKFDKKSAQTSHMKSCAVSHNVTTKQLLDALALQSKQAAERKALGLPETPVVAAQVPARKNVSRKGTGVPKDQNLQLALALSVSMKEAEQLELEKEEDALIEAGLGEEVMERQKSLLEKFGFTSSKPPSLDPANPRAGPKKTKCSVPILMTRSREERERLITEKVAIILMGKEDETETCQISEKSSDSKCRKQTLSSKYLLKFLNKECYLWMKAQIPPEGTHRNSYYVSYLDTFITPSAVVTGSQLKDISKIPCREKTPVRGSLSKADTNQEDYYQQSDLKPVKYIPEGPSDSLDNQEETDFSYDNNEKQDVLSCSTSSPPLPTESFLSFRKDCILKNWKMQVNNKTMSDVTIHVKGNVEVAAHRLVFFAQAPSILCDISEKSGEQGHLQWKDVSFSSALAFLHYIYCGSVEEICSLQEDVNDIRSLAVRYNKSELLNHLDKLKNMGSSALKHLHDECLNSRTGEKYNSSKPERTSRMSDTFQSHSELDIEDSADIPQQRNLQHCKEIGKCEDSAADNFCDIDYTEYRSNPQRFEEILSKSQIKENDNKSDRSSPDIFSESHTPIKTNDIQRDNIDILSSMLCKLTSGHEPTNIDDSVTDVHEDADSVCDLTQGSPEDYHTSDCEPAKVVEVPDESLSERPEDENVSCNLAPGTPEEYHSINFAGVLTTTPTPAKRKLSDTILTPSKCDSPSKKICKERDSSPLQLESINPTKVLSIPTDSFIDTIDLTQKSDGSYENEAYQQNCAGSSSMEENNQPGSGAAGTNGSSYETLPLTASKIHSFEIGKSDKEIQYNLNNCSEETSKGNDAYCSDNSTAVPENHENTSLPTSPLEFCRTEESPDYGITTFASPKSTLKPIDQITEETHANSPLSGTPLALRCLSQFPDATMRRSLSQMMSHLVDKDTQSLILAHDEVECKQISSDVTSAHDSDTPKTLKQTGMDSLKMMLEDSFVDQIRDNSFFREEFVNSPSGSHRTETHDNKVNDENSGNLEYQSITPVNKSSISEELTPLPDYSTMKTPQLKKELQKYGLKPLKRKQAKLILRHIYNELHPWVPANDTVTTQAVLSPTSSLVSEGRKGRENIAKQIKKCDPLVPTMRSPRKRNILKSLSDSAKASSSHDKENSEDEDDCDSEMFFGSNHNSKDYSILVDDEEIFHEQSATSENRSEGSQEVDLQTAVQNFIINNPEIHEKILMYEPVWLNDLKNGLKANKIKFKLNDLMDYLDEQCITYRTAAGPNKSRQRRKGVTASQSQNVGRKKRTTEEDHDPLPSSAY
ncbi:uncharacterized protein LOC124802863 isoform X1 [Schistocerca piceifrons]|uniref:uncharacterized protein LOC124802863 isoform X1 n=2 Tax=Schistocerca piceifrons TaxID=274613 RepID=UPI001F5E568B|nr:uncharacterized protein LOC124802863 isoform X1 [Schistocerca piceifrons]XP_047119857.1 uncharacterized protein LOC124802863 isoform X1 [Schistocerca piceifrons]